MISPSGMFDYLVIVPQDRSEDGFECHAETHLGVGEGPNLADPGLVGSFPRIRVTNAGPPVDQRLSPPWSLRKRSRITLIATEQHQARVPEASFYIDKTLTDCAKAGDQMHLSRYSGSSLGFSLIRGGKLVAAAGAITTVPLGSGVGVRIPEELISKAESAFQERDPDFEFVGQPVEIEIEGLRERYGQRVSERRVDASSNSFISFRGSIIAGEYRVIVRHGPFKMEDGPYESVSICDKHMFTHAAGEFAAMLLDGPEALSMARWAHEGH